MNPSHTIIIVLLASTCAEATSPDGARVPFEMCQSGERSGNRIQINFESATGSIEDVGGLVTRCGEDTSCMEFPINMAMPPRLPRSPGETIRWEDDGYQFELASAPEGSRYTIRSVSPPRVAPGGRFPPLVQFLTYDPREGVVQMRFQDDEQWLACAGNLRFEDLEGLLSRAPADVLHPR
jgi:hypothetical protein